MTIVFEKQKEKYLKALVGSPYTVPFKKLPFKTVLKTVESGKKVDLPFKVECLRLKHNDGALGYRVCLDGKVVVYCSDTGISKNAVKLAQDCALLIHDSTLEPKTREISWGHVGPKVAAGVAKRANAKKLVLTHFMPEFYPTIKHRMVAQKKAKEVFENTIIAKDKLTIKI